MENGVVASPVLIHEVVVGGGGKIAHNEADGPVHLWLATTHNATTGGATKLLALTLAVCSLAVGIWRDVCEDIHVGGGAKVTDAARRHVEADGRRHEAANDRSGIGGSVWGAGIFDRGWRGDNGGDGCYVCRPGAVRLVVGSGG